jgi:uncharacterized protein GlcG (DUF336 family)
MSPSRTGLARAVTSAPLTRRSTEAAGAALASTRAAQSHSGARSAALVRPAAAVLACMVRSFTDTRVLVSMIEARMVMIGGGVLKPTP